MSIFDFIKVAMLFALTAVAEIVGCYLPWLVLKQGKPVSRKFPVKTGTKTGAASSATSTACKSVLRGGSFSNRHLLTADC